MIRRVRYDRHIGVIQILGEDTTIRVDKDGGVFAHLTDEGYIKGVAFGTRANAVFQYSDGQEVWGELRLPEDVHDKKSLDTYNLSPMTLEHPEKFVDANNHKELAVGVIGDATPHGDFVRFPFLITDSDAVKRVMDGKTELSMGYTAIVVKQVGDFKGASFQYRQTDIQTNHCAIVDKGRAGPDCRIPPLSNRSDAYTVQIIEGNIMKKIKIDGKEYEVPDAVAENYIKLQADAENKNDDDLVEITVGDESFKVPSAVATHIDEMPEAIKKKMKGKEKDEDEEEGDSKADDGRIAALEARIKSDQDRFHERVDARVELVSNAKRIIDGFTAVGKSDTDIKHEVIGAVLPDVKGKLDHLRKTKDANYAAFCDGAYEVALGESDRIDSAIADANSTLFSTVRGDDSEDGVDDIYNNYIDGLNGKKAKE